VREVTPISTRCSAFNAEKETTYKRVSQLRGKVEVET